MDYWAECIAEAFEDAGISATKEQIDTVVAWVDGAHDNYSMATGSDYIPNPIETQATEELRELKRNIEKHEDWVNRTSPCRPCTTTGTVRDGWGRDVTCPDCHGTGRHRSNGR